VRGAARLKQVIKKILYIESPEESGSHYHLSINSLDVKLGEKESFGPINSEIPFINHILNSEADSFVDIGGYHGFYTILAQKSGISEVSVFEMSKENFHELGKNLELNNLGEQVTLNSIALWNTDCRLKAETDRKGKSKITGSKEGDVEARTLDGALEIEESDLIKLDVEGAELKILKGAEKILEENSPTILLELHKGERLEGFNHDPDDVVGFLNTKGFEVEFRESGKFDDYLILEKT
jgi:FkbM family methyltransferase